MSDVRWDVVTVGHLSRNKFWGESDDRAYRATRCTCTVIRSDGATVLVDPSLPPAELTTALDERTGLSPSDVDAVFLTHFHGDHRVGLDAFPHARWYMNAAEIRTWRNRPGTSTEDRAVLDRMTAAPEHLTPDIRLVATPGHTVGHASLEFDSDGLTVVVAGDAVMTEDFFWQEDYFHNTVNRADAVESIQVISRRADLVIPGHDNVVVNRRGRHGGQGEPQGSGGSAPSSTSSR